VTSLVWDGCVNVRDVGGLVRADNVGRLTEEGWSQLAAYGVERIVDLRFPAERELDPPADVPVEVVTVPLLGEGHVPEWQAEFDDMLQRCATAEEYLVWSYLEFLERFRSRFALAFAAIATAPSGPVVVHCLGGKDRTGLVIALALRLSGRAIDEIADDYALSEANLAPRHAAWIESARNEVERRRLVFLLPAPAEAMRRVLVELERRHGTVEEYLRGSGVSGAELARVRARMGRRAWPRDERSRLVRRMLAAAAVAAAVLAPSAHAAGGTLNPQIAGLQVALRAWGLYSGPIDGIAGPKTAAGLHTFQRQHRLPLGTADPKTRVALGPLGHPLFGARTLRRGDFGWDVSVLQFVLQRAGYYHGALDGYLDAATDAALERYQAGERLSVDGVAGPHTLQTIALRGRVPVTMPAPPASAPPAAELVSYVVHSGDSLTAIAHRFHTSVTALARSNRLDPAHVLLIGTRLHVPERIAAQAPAVSPVAVRVLLDSWSTHFGVDPKLVRALAWMESGYQTSLVSPAGARGVLQLLPQTRAYVATVLLGKPLPATVSGDVEAGVALLHHLLGDFDGNSRLALAAWYEGEHAVRTEGVFPETTPFVDDVLALQTRM